MVVVGQMLPQDHLNVWHHVALSLGKVGKFHPFVLTWHTLCFEELFLPYCIFTSS